MVPTKIVFVQQLLCVVSQASLRGRTFQNENMPQTPYFEQVNKHASHPPPPLDEILNETLIDYVIAKTIKDCCGKPPVINGYLTFGPCV